MLGFHSVDADIIFLFQGENGKPGVAGLNGQLGLSVRWLLNQWLCDEEIAVSDQFCAEIIT